MTDPDPVVPRLVTSGTREPVRGDPPRTLGGTLATVALLAGVLFAAAAPPALLGGLLLGVAVGGGAAVVADRRKSDHTMRLCLPRAGVCVRL
ncbi:MULTISPECIES: hypothetical protein [Halolamina]|uniref:Uncharacterized protein n=1 Tax=Halolamina pelagica TaxID=699431 RepID=A0A1I5P7E9_9EURY|nr:MULTISPECIES: hypothetical protein [Halolamina]NHX36673.1 hypothetical protein [Halolamina sp. R1-12]SFP30034.1 hypothetical protein SAMN05216277_102395 [Halolamina pelagica]